MDSGNKAKYDFLNHLLSEGDAMVCLDARQSGVDVPKMHKHNPMLNLVFNLNFRRPFDVNEHGIFATLAFGGRAHKCAISFEAVWAIYEPETQKGQVWEESIPDDIDLASRMNTESTEETQKKPSRPVIKPVAAPVEAPASDASAPESPAEKPKRDRSHLRVIK